MVPVQLSYVLCLSCICTMNLFFLNCSLQCFFFGFFKNWCNACRMYIQVAFVCCLTPCASNQYFHCTYTSPCICTREETQLQYPCVWIVPLNPQVKYINEFPQTVIPSKVSRKAKFYILLKTGYKIITCLKMLKKRYEYIITQLLISFVWPFVVQR